MLLIGLLLGCQTGPAPQADPPAETGVSETSAPDTDAPDSAPADTASDTADTDKDRPSARLVEKPIGTTKVPDGVIWNSLCLHEDTLRLTTTNQHRIYLYQYSHELAMLGDEPLPRTLLVDNLPDDQLADFAMACTADRMFIAASNDAADDLFIASFTIDGEVLVPMAVAVDSGGLKTNDMHLLADDRGVHLLWGDAGGRKMRQSYTHDLEPSGFSELVFAGLTAQLGSTHRVDGEYWMFSGDETNNQILLNRFDLDWERISEPRVLITDADPTNWNWFPSGAARHEASRYWFVAYNHMGKWEDPKDKASIRMATFDRDLVLQDDFEITEVGFTRPHLAIYEDTLFMSYDGNRVYLGAYSIIAE